MATENKREITKEQYETRNLSGVFSEVEVMGYGVYGRHLVEEDGKYYVYFSLGNSCD